MEKRFACALLVCACLIGIYKYNDVSVSATVQAAETDKVLRTESVETSEMETVQSMEKLAQDIAAQEVTAQDAVTQDIAVQEVTAQDDVTQDIAAQEVTAQNAVTQDIAAQEVTAQDAVAQDIAVQNVAVQGMADKVSETIVWYGGVEEMLQGDFTAAAAYDAETEGSGEASPEQERAEDEMTGLAQESESEYANLAIADVTDYVNVRSLPSTSGEILGKIYDGAVAQILETVSCEDGEWFRVISGSVEGYIKEEYFIYGEAAAAVIDEYVTRYARVTADRLNIRKEATTESKRIGYLDNGEQAQILENLGEWYCVRYGDGNGYVASQYTTIVEEFVYAKSIEEEKAEEAARLALQQRSQVSEEHAPENITVTPPVTTYATNSELRGQIVDYAMQFLGNKYVHGGNSLTNGTDCSGFTSLIYADFGYSISRTPAGQLSGAGCGIDYSEIQPGDIICYGSKGKCTHVALYIGGGQIIHEANSRKGVVIYEADYDTILGVRNVID